MTIKEVAECTGLARSNIRFYEKEKLIEPLRNESNGYRDYSDKDVDDIKKIAYLRTLGISIEDIRNVMAENVTLYEVIEKQSRALEDEITELGRAKAMCARMLDEESISYKELQVEQYVSELPDYRNDSQTMLPDYWKDNQPVFRLDSVSFLYIWGSFLTWAVLTLLCLAAGILFYAKLPPEIPVQWSGGAASSMADKRFIFAYPAACILIRWLLRPCLYAKLHMVNLYSEMITEYMVNQYGEMIIEYLTNYMCFVVLSTEVFSILFVYGVVKSIVVVLLADTVVFIGLLLVGIMKMKHAGCP